ncbi:unnamed protein product [Dicrocoelium dendriticum]|nr:unnamed protein product [Dicrocoelium dendriticum]
MSVSFEQLQSLLQQQQAQFEKAQAKLIETLTKNLSLQAGSVTGTSERCPSAETLTQQVCEFRYDADAGITFESWFHKYEDLFRVDLAGASEDKRVRLMLRKLGAAEHEKFMNFILPKKSTDLTFDEAVATLSQIFGEQSSLFNIRYKCLTMTKRDDEDWVTYSSRVNRECERSLFHKMTADQYKCLIYVCGLQATKDADARTRVLSRIEQNPEITLQEVTNECQRLMNLKHDAAMIQQSSIQSSQDIICRVSRSPQKESVHVSSPHSKPSSACWFCREWHFGRNCPFRNHICNRCGKRGHKESCCLAKRPTMSGIRRRIPVRFRCHNEAKTVTATFKVDSVGRRKFTILKINDKEVKLQLDTASDITLICRDTWCMLGRPPLVHTDHTARNASGGILKLLGELHCQVSFRDQHIRTTCFVTDQPGLNLLGLDWMEELKLLDQSVNSICQKLQVEKPAETQNMSLELYSQIAELKRRHESLFQPGLGCCRIARAELNLKPDARPVFRPKRPVPYATQPIVESELNRLQSEGIIERVHYSEWAAPIVVIKKGNGKVRICADFSTGLNSMLENHQYPLPIPEDLFTKLNGGKWFAKLDLADAYLQVPVAENCRTLLTVNTHLGLFQYNRLPFGVKTAPAIFQQIMDTLLNDIPGVAVYLDDALIMGSDPQALLATLEKVLTRLEEAGFRLRAEKCNFLMESVKFLGFIIDKHGRRPDPANIEAVKQMPPPRDVAELRSFLGLISHYSAFLPSLHQTRGPLNELLMKGKEWRWTKECQQSFDTVKTALSSDLLLTHFNPNLEIVVASDASNYGVGAVISHVFPGGEEKAIAHAARSLTVAEKNYSQIEKEALAIVFAVKRFHKMLYGRHFKLITDHKPLLSIFGSKKGIPVFTASRLQRWATVLLAYDFSIQYRSTQQLGQADALSRLLGSHLKENDDCVIASVKFESEVQRILVDSVRELPVTSDTIRAETAQDDILLKVIGFVQSSWPNVRNSNELQPFFNRRGSLSVVDSCLMFGDRVVVPRKLRKRILQQFHSGHPGTSRMKALARSFVYWPQMDAEIEQFCQSCESCQQAAKAPPRCSWHPWPESEKPWQRIHLDYAGPINGQSYLIFVDSYTKWPDVIPMQNPTAQHTINELNKLFQYFGTPEMLVTDNGAQFTSTLFREFCMQNGIQHKFSPPYHPQSNGQAERFVDTFKRALLKAEGTRVSRDAIQPFLRMYRNTPNPNTPEGKSPSECLFGRKIRTTFDSLIPRNVEKRNGQPRRGQNNRLRTFKIGDLVYARNFQTPERWVSGTVSGKRGKVIYEIMVGKDKWTRHINHLRQRHGKTQRDQEPAAPQWDILLDTFGLENRTDPQSGTQPVAQTPHDVTCRPSRRRRQPRWLQVDPRVKSYDQAQVRKIGRSNQFKGGGNRKVSGANVQTLGHARAYRGARELSAAREGHIHKRGTTFDRFAKFGKRVQTDWPAITSRNQGRRTILPNLENPCDRTNPHWLRARRFQN